MPQAARARTEYFMGLTLDLRCHDALCRDITEMLTQPDENPEHLCFRQQSLNAIKLPKAVGDPDLFRSLSTADCLSADGMGVVWGARLLGIDVPERVTGIDLMKGLLPHFAKAGVRIFLLGARDDVVQKLQRKLCERYPGLIIAGYHHGYEPDDAKLAAVVQKSNADALFVALPSPRKEVFIDRFVDQTGCRFAMGVGGAFDVLSGDVKRAPIVWQKLGLEFLWRIVCQPKYMIPRYTVGLWAFARLMGPKVLASQVGRLCRVARRAMIFGIILPILAVGVDGHADTLDQAAFTFDDRASAKVWIEQQIGELTEPKDIDQMIDVLMRAVLEPENTNEDWQAAEASLQALLDLVGQILADAGTGSFLLETVVGGVIARMLELHPEPGRVSRLVQLSVPEMAERMFRRTGMDATLFEQEEVAAATPQPVGSGVVSVNVTPDWRAAREYEALAIEALLSDTQTELWDSEFDEDNDPFAALEDASPR
jgi:N-acetylglucosaminyldiphosphoundecaprenol N-acetyl-beta-D-mannosaminyltransferase